MLQGAKVYIRKQNLNLDMSSARCKLLHEMLTNRSNLARQKLIESGGMAVKQNEQRDFVIYLVPLNIVVSCYLPDLSLGTVSHSLRQQQL